MLATEQRTLPSFSHSATICLLAASTASKYARPVLPLACASTWSVTLSKPTVTSTRKSGLAGRSSARPLAMKPSLMKLCSGELLYWITPIATWWLVSSRPSADTNEPVPPPARTTALSGGAVTLARSAGLPLKPAACSGLASSGSWVGIHMPSSAWAPAARVRPRARAVGRALRGDMRQSGTTEQPGTIAAGAGWGNGRWLGAPMLARIRRGYQGRTDDRRNRSGHHAFADRRETRRWGSSVNRPATHSSAAEILRGTPQGNHDA